MKWLLCGNEKVMLDLTFLMMVINPQQISPVVDGFTIA